MQLTSAATLRALIKQRGFSLGQLAQQAGCSKGFISHLLAGRRTTCTPPLAARIAKSLNVPLNLLFTSSLFDDNEQNINYCEII